MTHYQIHITDEAIRDMESVYGYIAKELFAPETAMRQYNRIADAIETLDKIPERIKLVDSEPEKTRGFRKLIVDNYAIFFIIKDDIVIVTNVMY